jgi:hypothetical protein
VKIFKRNTDEWDLESTVTYDEGDPKLDEFGGGVFLSENYLVVGAYNAPLNGKKYVGKILIYSKTASGGWSKIQSLRSDTSEEKQQFGPNAFDGQSLIASAYDTAPRPKLTMYSYERRGDGTFEKPTSGPLPPAAKKGRAPAPPKSLPPPETVSPVGPVAAQCPTYTWKRVEGATQYKIHFRFPAQRSGCGQDATTVTIGDKTITVNADDYCTLDLCYLGNKKVPGRIFHPKNCDGTPAIREWAVTAVNGSVQSQESPFASYQWDGSKPCPY